MSNAEYTKTTWATGDIINDTKLNNIESGIEKLVTFVNTIDLSTLATKEEVAAKADASALEGYAKTDALTALTSRVEALESP